MGPWVDLEAHQKAAEDCGPGRRPVPTRWEGKQAGCRNGKEAHRGPVEDRKAHTARTLETPPAGPKLLPGVGEPTHRERGTSRVGKVRMEVRAD